MAGDADQESGLLTPNPRSFLITVLEERWDFIQMTVLQSPISKYCQREARGGQRKARGGPLASAHRERPHLETASQPPSVATESLF